MLVSRSDRWRERRRRFVDDSDPIDPRAYAVDIVEHRTARAFVAAHHYLPTWPAVQLAVGLHDDRRASRDRLVGVAVFAVPAIGAVIRRHAGLADAAAGTTLARFILLDDVPQNGESFFLARAFRLLRREEPGIEAVVSYADPAAGHVGQIYAAMSGAYRGQTARRGAYRIGATTIPGRTLSKVRLGERGAGAGIDRLVALGAPRPGLGETPTAWLDRLALDGTLARTARPGLHAYSFALTRRARAAARVLPCHPYPTLAALLADRACSAGR